MKKLIVLCIMFLSVNVYALEKNFTVSASSTDYTQSGKDKVGEARFNMDLGAGIIFDKVELNSVLSIAHTPTIEGSFGVDLSPISDLKIIPQIGYKRLFLDGRDKQLPFFGIEGRIPVDKQLSLFAFFGRQTDIGILSANILRIGFKTDF